MLLITLKRSQIANLEFIANLIVIKNRYATVSWKFLALYDSSDRMSIIQVTFSIDGSSTQEFPIYFRLVRQFDLSTAKLR